jgi:hypothetical protein
MAAPIIDSIDATPDVVAPGGTFTVTIVAHDPDERTVNLVGMVVDAGGNQSVPAQVSIRIADPISYSLTGDGFTITPKPGSPGVFNCVAP